MENMDLIYKRVINASLDVIISINEKEEILLWNDASSKTFGYMEDEVLGKPITLIIPKKYHRKHKNGMRRFIKTGKAKLIGKVVEVEGIKKDGSLFPIELSLSASKSRKGFIFTAIIRDISERKFLEKKLEDMAIRDSLTWMYNRHYFNEVINREFERAKRYRYFISMMIIDVDKFKIINDNYGHARGDLVLKGIAECLEKNLRSSDIVIRYGGDEFLAVLPKANGRDLRTVMEKVKKRVKEWSENSDFGFPVSISCGGYALNPDRKKNVDEVLKEADKRLYKDKKR
ncbi:MAG: hypothetical protein A3H23_10125 [Planctomycetes bacterium RIFCSPLOWO2_12_FULL_40_19]|nr:MAG: hypothetical protein A3H23_10125 [Planctomycetes bacterium RIFCSPLOWO2_12_FULL_40_19]